MQFEFRINLLNGVIESEDSNFFLATEFKKNDLKTLAPHKIFPDRDFYQSIVARFNSRSSEKVHFYNYLYTIDARRIRVTGTAIRYEEGFLFRCRREKIKDATFVEFEQKNSLLTAINKSAELFLSQLNWKNVIYKTLQLISRAGNFSSVRLWQFTRDNEKRLTLLLKGTNNSNSFSFINKEIQSKNFEPYLIRLKKNESIISLHPVNLLDNNHKSELFIPVIIEKSIWGALEILDINERRWSSDEITAIESFAKILASAIRSYSINKKLEETQKKLNLITHTTRSVFYSRKIDQDGFDYISPSYKSLVKGNGDNDPIDIINDLVLEKDKKRIVYRDENTNIQLVSDSEKPLYIMDKKFPWYDENGRTYGVIGILQDITETMEHQIQLTRNNKVLNAVNNFTQLVLNKKDPDTNLNRLLKYIGEAVETDRVFLFTKNENTSKFSLNSFWFNNKFNEEESDIYELEFSQEEIDSLSQKLSSGRAVISEQNKLNRGAKSSLILPIFKNNSLYAFLGFDEFKSKREWTKAEQDALGIAAKVIGASFELTDYISELIIAKKEAQKSDRLKSEFISQISHEIRSPLNIIMSFLGMMWEELRETNREEITDIYDTIQKASKRLVRSVDLLIEASTIQSGMYDANFEKFDFIEDIVHPLFVTNKPKSEKKKVLLLRESSSLERTVFGDKKSLFAMMDNLLSNAIKYTDEGHIKVIDYNEGNNIIIEIEDTGRGISPEYLSKMYFPFTQESEGLDRSDDGLGLGMFIVKKYCEINNVELSVDSKVSEGTKFTIKIPLAKFKDSNCEAQNSLSKFRAG